MVIIIGENKLCEEEDGKNSKKKTLVSSHLTGVKKFRLWMEWVLDRRNSIKTKFMEN